jgi:hypothetical protein
LPASGDLSIVLWQPVDRRYGSSRRVFLTQIAGTCPRGTEMFADQNVETTKNGYEAFASGDVESALSNFDDNIES